MKTIIITLCIVSIAGVLFAEKVDLDSVVRDSGVSGGLIVHINAVEIGQTAKAAMSGKFLIHGLYTNENLLRKAKLHISSSNLGGQVTVSLLDGKKLPFVDNCVNAIVVNSEKLKVNSSEIERVLAPRGKLICPKGISIQVSGLNSQVSGEWMVSTKPVPSTIDDWTHNLYDPSNNAVSKDMQVGIPRKLQWVGDPLFCRSHDANNSFQAMVSSAGRIFYIMDEGSKAFLSLPSKWFLTARDGFNGKILWKKKLPQALVTHLDQLKSGMGNLAHRIVAEEDKVYVTLGFNAPVSALDSRTGKEIWVSGESANAEELILLDGVLYCIVNMSDENKSVNSYMSMNQWNRRAANTVRRKVIALDSLTGKKIWEHTPEKTILPLSMTVGENKLYIHDGESIVALNRGTGEKIWTSEPVDYWRDMGLHSGVNLVLYDGVLLFSSTQSHQLVKTRKKENVITALDAETGKVLWSKDHRQFTNYFTATDLMVADGLVWSAGLFNTQAGGKYMGLDPKTGKVIREFAKDPSPHMPHHRCHRNRGTERYLFTGRTGVNIFDVNTGLWSHDNWVRGTCRYGMMPANGILYTPPNSCACYVGTLVRGFNAMTAGVASSKVVGGRLVKGVAYGKTTDDRLQTTDNEWDTFRGTVDRHGMAGVPMDEEYALDWKTSLKGLLSQPVVSAGKVIVSAIDEHTVYALDEGSGKVIWSFLAGGKVDSPPTLWEGRAVFGCSDGWVYSVDMKDGALIWKYRAAPVDRRIIAYESVESVWPVSGSVLVLPDEKSGKARVYCIAGRSMFMDGGLRMLVLDAESGKMLAETVMDESNPETGKHMLAGKEWPPDSPSTLSDVLSYANGKIYMGQQAFDTDGKREKIHFPKREDYFPGRDKMPVKKKDISEDHMFATTGFLDGNQWHRGIWYYGSDSLGSCWSVNVPAFITPSGNILTADDSKVYGYGREFFVEGTKQTAHLFGVDKNPEVADVNRLKDEKIEIRGPYALRGQATTPLWNWSKKTDVYIRAMVVARNTDAEKGNILLAAGAPDIIDEYSAMNLIQDQQRKGFHLEKLYEKEKAVEGKLGAKLIVVSATDGDVLSETMLEFPPVFDGMSAANGKIFISNMNGDVVCLISCKVKP